MSVNISTLIDEVLPDVIGCPYPLIERAVRQVLQDFCGATHIINKAVLATSTTSVDVGYALNNYEVCDLLRLQIDDIEYTAIRIEPTDEDDELDDISTTQKKFWYPESGGKITITPFDTDPTEIRLIVVFRPTMSADTVEDIFYDDWHSTIVAGVKAKLMLMPKKAWTDKDFGQFNQKEYKKGEYAAIVRVQASLGETVTVPVGRI
jgi:hypothetical protein